LQLQKKIMRTPVFVGAQAMPSPQYAYATGGVRPYTKDEMHID
jgi:hypothetical protein